MARQKRRSRAAPRSKRRASSRRAAPGALGAATSVPGACRTLVYVHGIGNKPLASILKCQWDEALFGFGLGERSRLAYWVNRAYYPSPLAATCASGDKIELEEEPTGRGLTIKQQLDATSLEDEVKALTSKRKAQAELLAMARKMEFPPVPPTAQRLAARAVEAKVLPLPEIVRQWITRKLTRGFLRDAHDFFYDAERRGVMRESFVERLRPGGGPFVVIAHSMGSVIAYDQLSRLDPGTFDVRLLVTVGSPLGIQEVQDNLKGLTGQSKLRVPACVRSWLNVADPLDPVALDKFIRGDYAAQGGVEVEDDLEWNEDSPRHPHSGTGYLKLDLVRRRVRREVDVALFQPVADFTIARDLVRAVENGRAEVRHAVLIELVEPGTPPATPGASPADLARARPGETLDQVRARVVGAIRREANGASEDALGLLALARFVAANLTREEVEHLSVTLGRRDLKRSIRRVWKNALKRALLEASAQTVQAIPAHVSYSALGRGIAWAVLDSGINPDHPHFAKHKNLVAQVDCTRVQLDRTKAVDGHGHGTHVAGIIAGVGEFEGVSGGPRRVISGIAPEAKLHVYKVLNDQGEGNDAWIIRALDDIAALNEAAPSPVIHGINLSLGGPFDQSVFGCGHSPLCRELRRLWRQGVVLVIAAGNEGFAVLQTLDGTFDANLDLSISDPANLEEAIAVGSVHKDAPHTYGVSYFSSRGPTADGRPKPDVVAPGERILSCRHRWDEKKKDGERRVDDLYVEMSGTSMAAPHVSGVAAAFLSARREFVGYPDRVKEILLDNCTDIRRDRPHQGRGVPNLVKMLVNT
jgi:subtilisin family serine protease